MRKLFLAIATVTIVSMVSLGSHRAEASVRDHSVFKRLRRRELDPACGMCHAPGLRTRCVRDV